MKSRLQSYLKNHETSSTITELKLEKEAVNTPDENKQTPMQLAMQDGRTDIILWLLANDADKSEVSPAVKRKHPLVYDITHVTDPLLMHAIFLYGLRMNSKTLQASVKPPAVLDLLSESKLEPRYKKAYEFAINKSSRMVSIACSFNTVDYSLIFQHAFSLMNYDALKTIIAACNQHEDLLKEFLLKGRNDCAKFLIVAAGMDVYQAALSLRKEKKLLDTFLNIAWTRDGLVEGLVDRCVLSEEPQTDIINLAKSLADRDKLTELYENAMHKRYGLPVAQESSPEIANRLQLLVPIEHKHRFPLPDDLAMSVFTWCNKEEKKALRESSKHLRFLINRGLKPTQFNTQHQLDFVTKQLTLLNHFIESTKQEQKEKGWSSHSSQLFSQQPTKIKIYLLLAFTLTITGLGFLIYGIERKITLKPLLANSTVFNSTRSCLNDDCIADMCSDDHLMCDLSCNGCRDLNRALSFEVLGGVLAVAAFLRIFGDLVRVSRSHRSQRFDDLPLSSYKKGTRVAAEAMFAEFKGTLFNPFENHHMDSKVGQVLAKAIKEREKKQSEQKKLLTRNNRLEIKVQNESDHKEENQDWDLTLPASMNAAKSTESKNSALKIALL